MISAAALHDVGTGMDVPTLDKTASVALTACTSDAQIGEFTHSRKAVSVTWTTSTHKHERLTETIVQTSSTKKADALSKRLVSEISSCQHEPK